MVLPDQKVAITKQLHFILIFFDLYITIRDNLTFCKENERAGPNVIYSIAERHYTHGLKNIA